VAQAAGRVACEPDCRGQALERLILDTTILIAAERSTALIEEAISDGDDVAIAAVTAAELLVGVQLANDRRRVARQAFVGAILATVPIEPYDLNTARAHSDLMVWTRAAGRVRGAHDLLIAATARVTERTVLTADATGFIDLPGVTVRTMLDHP
jgi:tRNA(fMet)-specific endonuclease VapC